MKTKDTKLFVPLLAAILGPALLGLLLYWAIPQQYDTPLLAVPAEKVDSVTVYYSLGGATFRKDVTAQEGIEQVISTLQEIRYDTSSVPDVISYEERQNDPTAPIPEGCVAANWDLCLVLHREGLEDLEYSITTISDPHRMLVHVDGCPYIGCCYGIWWFWDSIDSPCICTSYTPEPGPDGSAQAPCDGQQLWDAPALPEETALLLTEMTA